ncbi:THO complex subunit 4A-like [Argentina anserina]|uniref:THO complex subunit 4A-like n=1 Tax=Argentina anserina TaxID=57926 RepID=UPI0021767DF7|nr:THO complex subunit 4A-like [Potentilla anserina]
MPFSDDRLDLPLDALVAETNQQRRQNHPPKPRGHNGHFPRQVPGGFTLGGPARRPRSLRAFITAPYPPTQPIMQGQLGPGRREEVPLGWSPGVSKEGSTKLYISNLDYDVTHRDIELLFSDVGELERHAIHYDKSGRSKGTAEVVYKQHADAVAAIKRFNNHRLDGKKLEIKLVGNEVVATVPVFLPPNAYFLQEQPSHHVFQRLGRTESRGSFHGHGDVGYGRVQGQVRNGSKKVTTEAQQWKNVTTESQQRRNVTTEYQKGKNVMAESHNRKKTFYGDVTVTFEDLDADLEDYRLSR